MIRFPRLALRRRPEVIGEGAGALQVEIGGASVPVTVRRSARASRYGLRIANATGEVILTVPARGDDAKALDFLTRHEGWLERRLGTRAPAVPFADGAQFPLRGVPHVICATGKSRGAVRREVSGETALLHVPGAPEHLARRLTDWLKGEARADIAACVAAHCEKIGRKAGRIGVRDTVSRWGSCSAKGGLSFSWRLVLAPPFVLDYVAAHEVAHLEHMNHGPRFWARTRELFPATDRAERWLRQNGRELHRYGREDIPAGRGN